MEVFRGILFQLFYQICRIFAGYQYIQCNNRISKEIQVEEDEYLTLKNEELFFFKMNLKDLQTNYIGLY
jgi:hypothetical protein